MATASSQTENAHRIYILHNEYAPSAMPAKLKRYSKYLNNIPFVGKENTQNSSSTDQELDSEGIDGRIVRGPELELDQIDNVQ
jgi:hypothetical protein